MDLKSKIILISGPTASGKTSFAIKLAKKVNGEIINADSMQVYKELKILTARPSIKEQKKIKHHLYGFQKVNHKRFPSIKLINKSLKFGLSTPTIINASNEVLVDLFLRGKIGFLDIVKTINKIFKDKDFKKYAKRKPNSVNDIKITDKWARLKTRAMCVR